MIDTVQTFFLYLGFTLFIGGFSLCFIPRTFRYGVFCSILGNLCLVFAIIFVKHFIDFLNKNDLAEIMRIFTLENIQLKAIIIGIILMSLIWGTRWLKHFGSDIVFKIIFVLSREKNKNI